MTNWHDFVKQYWEVPKITSIKESDERARDSNMLIVETNEEIYALTKSKFPNQWLAQSAQIVNYLYDRGLNVPYLVHTKKKEYITQFTDGSSYMLHTLVMGQLEIDHELLYRNIPSFAQQLALLHRTLYEFNPKKWKVMDQRLKQPEALFQEIQNLNSNKFELPNNTLVKHQLETWKKNYQSFSPKSYINGIIHGNLVPNQSIVHINGNIEGFVNFLGVMVGYYMYDLAKFIVETGLFKADRIKVLLLFLEYYNTTGPIKQAEFKDLLFFMRAVLLVDILKLEQVIKSQTIGGSDSALEYENLLDFKLDKLQEVSRLPENFHFEAITNHFT
jgi:Ser/Thr protein kinase RdoA (MazF antagonist)